ncbi:MAG: hypothetical protein PVI00_17545 [Desulfobacterales bacterium]|jgi:hypothetical protein
MENAGMNLLTLMRNIRTGLILLSRKGLLSENHSLMVGRLLVELIKNKRNYNSLADLEFKVFSQFGDDGIIQYLINNLCVQHSNFIEFGVQDYRESTTRFLMMNDNWTGLIMDASPKNIKKIIHSEYYWKFQLIARHAFVTAENINQLISDAGINGELGLLHIDIDGNDYWVWKAIDIVRPVIAIIEYNSIFGIDRPITTPYDKNFQRTKAHFSNLYFGASLGALLHLARQKKYAFIGCNSAGNNAYFVRRDKLNANVHELSLQEGYVLSRFRESRDRTGNLSYITGNERLNTIRGMPVFNVENNQIEHL